MNITGRKLYDFEIGPGLYRLILAAIVFVHHFSSLDVGPFAVYVFFVLSGFWVERMWVAKYARYRSPYLTYLVSRVWRLAPTLCLVMILTLVFYYFYVPSAFELSWKLNKSFLAVTSIGLLGYSFNGYMPVGSAWSLDPEMQFYIVLPLAAWVVSRFRSTYILIVSAVAGILFSGFEGIHIIPKYLIFFMTGVIASHRNWKPSKKLAIISAIFPLGLVILLLASPLRSIVLGGSHSYPYHWMNPSFNVALAIVTIPFAISTVWIKGGKYDRDFADYSYVIYLVHWPAMQWFYQTQGRFIDRLLAAAISFALVPLVSLLILKLFDQPVNRWRGRWLESRQRYDERPRDN